MFKEEIVKYVRSWELYYRRQEQKFLKFQNHHPRQIFWSSFIFLVFFLYWFFIAAPVQFPVAKLVNIKKGLNNTEIAEMLHSQSVISCQFCFTTILRVYPNNGVIAGQYAFDRRLSLFSTIYRLTRGDFGVTPYRITIPEGTNNHEMAKLLKKHLTYFNEDRFLSLADNLEGQLFPDTYVFTPDTTEDEVIKTMNANFKTKIFGVEKDILKSKHTLNEVLTMASIIEEEARTPETRRMVSGILWKRYDEGMRLQVDAVFKYMSNKTSAQITQTDLATSSPYNTYRKTGLPPTPITNPGLDSILAAIYPTASPYYYYLSDGNGNMHYAKTFAGHKDNRVYLAN